MREPRVFVGPLYFVLIAFIVFSAFKVRPTECDSVEEQRMRMSSALILCYLRGCASHYSVPLYFSAIFSVLLQLSSMRLSLRSPAAWLL